MFIPLFAAVGQYIFGTLMFLTSLFLILLVLVQRGRGGGLAGAFGGMGGQSAFGTKAGDLFTKLTMGVATFWILLCILAIGTLNRQSSVLGGSGGGPPSVLGTSLSDPDDDTDTTDSDASDPLGLGASGLEDLGLGGGLESTGDAGETGATEETGTPAGENETGATESEGDSAP